MTVEPTAALRRDDALALWREYVAHRGPGFSQAEDPAVERFGDSAAMADELIALVLAGTKRATAALVKDFAAEGEPLPGSAATGSRATAAVPRAACSAASTSGWVRWPAWTRSSPGTRVRASGPGRAGWPST